MNPIIARELITQLRTIRGMIQLFLFLLISSFIFCVYYHQAWQTWANRSIDGRDIFFPIIYLIFLLVVPVVSMASVAIVHEREADTLDLLLTTQQGPGSILWGKLIAVVLAVLLIICSSIPILSLCFILGGLAPDELIQSFYLILCFYCFASSLGLCVSLVSSSSGIATRAAVFLLFLYLCGPYAFRVVYAVLANPINVNPVFSYELWFNPIWAMSELTSPGHMVLVQDVTQSRLPKNPSGVILQWLYAKQTTPGFLTGTLLLFITATLFTGSWLLLRLHSSSLSNRFSWREWIRFPAISKHKKSRAAASDTSFEPFFDPQKKAVIQKEVLSFNRKFITRDITMVVSCGLLCLLFSLILFKASNGGKDITHHATFISVGIFGLGIATLFSPLLPSYSVWQERFKQTWPLLRTTTILSEEIIRGKLYACFRQTALPLVSIVISCYGFNTLFFYSYGRPVDTRYLLEISMLSGFFLICIYFYSCIGILNSSKPVSGYFQPQFKTFFIVFVHIFAPFLLQNLLIWLCIAIIGPKTPYSLDASLYTPYRDKMITQINATLSNMALISPAWFLSKRDWTFNTTVILLIHSMVLLTLSRYCVQRASLWIRARE